MFEAPKKRNYNEKKDKLLNLKVLMKQFQIKKRRSILSYLSVKEISAMKLLEFNFLFISIQRDNKIHTNIIY